MIAVRHRVEIHIPVGEIIDLGGGGHQLTLDEQAVLDLSDTDTLRVDGDSSDAVTGSGWTEGASTDGYTTWTQGAATLLVDTDIIASLV